MPRGIAGSRRPHWPAGQPPEVQHALATVHSLAPDIETQENRTLAEIDEAERAADPVHQLETRHRRLRTLVARAMGDEAHVVQAELKNVTAELQAARRQKRVDRTLDRYRKTPWGQARRRPPATLEGRGLGLTPVIRPRF